jgi:ABC-type amino acid transport substrate-binding protein
MIKYIKLPAIGILIVLIYYAWFLFGNKPPKDKFVLAVTYEAAFQQKAEEFQRVEKIKSYRDQSGVLKSVSQGQADVGIINGLIALNLIHQTPEFQDLRLAGNLLFQESAGVAFNRNHDSLRQAINRGLVGIIENGIYESVSRRYFGRDISAALKPSLTYQDNIPTDDDSWKKRRLADELRFAMSGNNLPFSYLNERDQLTGFDVDLAREVCIQLGIKTFTPVLVEQKDLLKGLMAGEYDGIWNSMRITEENLMLVDFSTPYYVTGAQLVVPEKSPITGPETLFYQYFRRRLRL